jgi:hypothetical protein
VQATSLSGSGLRWYCFQDFDNFFKDQHLNLCVAEMAEVRVRSQIADSLADAGDTVIPDAANSFLFGKTNQFLAIGELRLIKSMR